MGGNKKERGNRLSPMETVEVSGSKSHHWSAEPGFQLRTSESRILALKALGIPWVGVLGYKEGNLLS